MSAHHPKQTLRLSALDTHAPVNWTPPVSYSAIEKLLGKASFSPARPAVGSSWESYAKPISKQDAVKIEENGAGGGNRTRTKSLGSGRELMVFRGLAPNCAHFPSIRINGLRAFSQLKTACRVG